MAAKVTLRAAGYVIYRKVNGTIEYLLLQSASKDHHWTPPKGHVEAEEQEEQTAPRELREETGLTLDDVNVIPGFKRSIMYSVNNRPKTVTYWMAEIKDPGKVIVLSDEHEDFKWLPFEEALATLGYGTAQGLLKDCNFHLVSNNF